LDAVIDAHAVEIVIIRTQAGRTKYGEKKTYNVNPPQRPSRLMSINTKIMLELPDSSPKNPMADSYIKVR